MFSGGMKREHRAVMFEDICDNLFQVNAHTMLTKILENFLTHVRPISHFKLLENTRKPKVHPKYI